MRKGILTMSAMALALVGAGAATAQFRRVGGLAALDGGQWELRPRAGSPERLCIRDGRQLIQLRHPRQLCEQVVVQDEPHDITVQYTCPGRGYGRTHIRPETSRLAQVETQGIVDGLPFFFEAELRWVGARCPG